jgi:thiamine pyrophosphokinase
MRAVVVAGGDADPRDAELIGDADLVIAADGGAAFLDSVGRLPDLLVGDMDSADEALVERLAAAGVVVDRHPAAKDATDAELALDRAAAAGARQITVIGAFAGERLDHELANLLLLVDPSWARALDDLRMVRGATLARAVHGPGEMALESQVGGTVSLLPVGGDAGGVRTNGLQFPLRGETLGLGRSRGLSNVVVSRPASVSLDTGVLLVIETATEGVEA